MESKELMSRENCFLELQKILPAETIAKLSIMVLAFGTEQTINVCKTNYNGEMPDDLIEIIRKGLDHMQLTVWK